MAMLQAPIQDELMALAKATAKRKGVTLKAFVVKALERATATRIKAGK